MKKGKSGLIGGVKEGRIRRRKTSGFRFFPIKLVSSIFSAVSGDLSEYSFTDCSNKSGRL